MTGAALAFGGLAMRAGTASTGDVRREAVPFGLVTRASFDARAGASFAARAGRVSVVAASYPERAVALRIVDAPQNVPIGEVLARVARDGDLLAAVNGGYFLAGGAPDGLLVEHGVTISRASSDLSGVVGARAGGAPFVATTAEALDFTDVRDAQQSGPFIVDPGGTIGIRRDDGYPARRTIVLLGNGRIVFVTTSVVGLLDVAERLVASPELFGIDRVERALNLDGGPSTAMYVRLARGRSLIVSEEGPLRTIVTLAPRRSED